jgi:acetoin utilization deacetylase AcuC-like enzyme
VVTYTPVVTKFEVVHMGRLTTPVRRLAQRLGLRLHPPDVGFVHHADYVLPVPGIPLDPLRAERIVAYLLDARLIRPRDLSQPIPVSLEHISRVHTRAYLESLDRPEAMERIFGFPVSDELGQQVLDYQRLLAGGTVQATRLALRTGRIAINLGGGFHHALPDRGMGFSIFNDIAIAIARLRARGFAEPVMVVDLDLHDGNGTRRVYAEDPTVYTFSIHNETWDDGPAIADTCIALGPDVGDERFLTVLRKELPPALRAHRPRLVLYVAGTDLATDDVIGNWKISGQGMFARDQFVVEQAGRCPISVVLAGGYGRRAWRYSARFFAWLVTGRILDPSEDIDAVVRRFRRVLTRTSGVSRGRERGKADWTLSEDDIDLGSTHGRGTRVLGQLSKHTIELTLERLGLLHQVRSMGFLSPTVVVDLESPLGHTIRLFGDPGRAELLMELRLNVKRDAIPGMETLYVEWLLLQNPRDRFTNPGRRLPGQEFPGLGLLREIVGWLIVVCEELGLDGIAFSAAHYYMATLGRRHLEFVRPEDAAVFEALREAVPALDLTEASRAIDEGRVVAERTGEPVRWAAPLMVLPLSERLRAHISRPDYRERARRARAELNFVLRST